jgi:hypothetical protein
MPETWCWFCPICETMMLLDEAKSCCKQPRRKDCPLTAERRRTAFQQALDLLRDLRDCPIADLELRQAEIDLVVKAGEECLTTP